MTTSEPSANSASRGAQLTVRDVLASAWPLFQVCLPTCLPLAIVGVAAGATPNAQDLAHNREWWGVVAASTLLTLICYGAVLRQQLAIAAGVRPQLLESLRRAAGDLPQVLLLVLLCVLPLAPAILATAQWGFGLAAALLTLLAAALLVFTVPVWPALIVGNRNAWAALVSAATMVRNSWRVHAAVVATVVAGVLIYVLLAGILIGMVMNLAGQGVSPSAGGLAFSRWVLALVLALPVVYTAAVSVAVFRASAPS